MIPDTETAAAVLRAYTRSPAVEVATKPCNCGAHINVRLYWADSHGFGHVVHFDLPKKTRHVAPHIIQILYNI